MSIGRDRKRAPHEPVQPRDDASAHRRSRVQELWEHLQACTLQIADEVQHRLRVRFRISVARFDLMAQLHQRRGGMDMKTLARCLMVTSGNVTGLTEHLEREGLVTRETSRTDRRVRIARLTASGRRRFEHIEREHGQWMLELLSGLDADAIDQLHNRLGALRVQLCGPTDSSNEDTSWNILCTESTPPCLPAAAGRRRATKPSISAGRSSIASRP